MVSDYWLTYTAAAERLGVSAEAVRQLAIRHKWPRRRPNADPHGRVEIAIPADFEARPRSTVQHPSDHLFDTRLSGELDTLRAALDRERKRADQAENRADAAVSRADAADLDSRSAIALADQTVTLLADASARADRAEAAVAAERGRADALRDRLNAMQEQFADAHAALQAAELAETRVAAAEGRADRAEQAIAGERARADAVQARLDSTQEQLAAEAEAANQARRQAQAAQDNAETLLEADAARKGRGRLARLRAAWRGE